MAVPIYLNNIPQCLRPLSKSRERRRMAL